MMKLTKLILPLTLIAAAGAVVAQVAPAPQAQATPARRQVMQKLTADFRLALQNGGLQAEDRQKAEAALAQVQQHHTKGAAPVDPKARHAAMATIQQMAANPALREEDRQVLAKDLADLKALRQHRKA